MQPTPIKSQQELEAKVAEIGAIHQAKSRKRILVSLGTCGVAAGTTPVLDQLKKSIAEQQLDDSIEVVETGCMGLCHSEPTLEVQDPVTNQSLVYGNVTPDQVDAILFPENHKPPETVECTWYRPEDETAHENRKQIKIVLRNSGRIDPENIDDYLLHAGYQALTETLTRMTPDQVIETIDSSALRGRGGGGFPTGRKWRFAAREEASQKYVICNADEGDPGAFMDRAILEGDPHAVIEAMIIAGYAIGASSGIVYVRAEYPLAIKRLQLAIQQAESYGFLGENILESGFEFGLELRFGAGAFVCGEETALIQSIEGQRGMPTFKPPFPAVAGLWGKPTIVNNVETFANIPTIIRNGPDWFRQIGTESSPGTKVFALAGKINNVGLVEVPMGTTLREIVFEIGGGIPGNKRFKAAQTGGPSGGCITGENLDIPIDYDSLKNLGTMMGSGGLIIMDEDDCMVNVAKFFLDFTMDESCGKCTPCRIGSKQMHMILERITVGNGTEQDIQRLHDIAKAMKIASLCGLGQTAPNPILSTLHNFHNEYMAHINEKTCPAGCCREMLTYFIDANTCVGCTLCAKACPVQCIDGKLKEAHSIRQKDCIHCGECFKACKFNAVIKE